MTDMRHLVSVNSSHVGAHSDFWFEKDLASTIVDKIVKIDRHYAMMDPETMKNLHRSVLTVVY